MKKHVFNRYFIAGGAGFIGAHLVNSILDNSDAEVTVYDNFSTGRRWAFGDRIHDKRLTIIEADASDEKMLDRSISNHDIVYQLAANSDIAKAESTPSIDFWNGTVPTNNILEAMRKASVNRIVFTSGSGVYGDVPAIPIPEYYDRMIPISTYGACKLACESLISAYSHMFGITGTVFRFANVVGAHQTHGVAYDFIRRLAANPRSLKIYGDGLQSKPYIHVKDVLGAFQLMEVIQKEGYDVFNVGTEDHLTVKEIADIVCKQMNLKEVIYQYTGGQRGWKADVPVYRLNSKKIREKGWRNLRNSYEAVTDAVASMLLDIQQGNIIASAD